MARPRKQKPQPITTEQLKFALANAKNASKFLDECKQGVYVPYGSMGPADYADAATQAWEQFVEKKHFEFVELAAMIVRTGLKDDETVVNNSGPLESVFDGCIGHIVELCEQDKPDLQQLRAFCLLARLAFRTPRLQRKFLKLRVGAIESVLSFLFAQPVPDRILGNDVLREERRDPHELRLLVTSSIVDLAGLLTFKPVSIRYESPESNDEADIFKRLISGVYKWGLRWLDGGENVPEWTLKVLSSFFHDVSPFDKDPALEPSRNELFRRLLSMLQDGHPSGDQPSSSEGAELSCVKAAAECVANWCNDNPSLQPSQLDEFTSALLRLGREDLDSGPFMSVVKGVVSCTSNRPNSLTQDQYVQLFKNRPDMEYQANVKLLRFASLLLRSCRLDEGSRDTLWLQTFRDVANSTIADTYDAAKGAMWPLLHCNESESSGEAQIMSSVVDIAFSSLSWCEAAFDHFAKQFWLGDVALDELPDGWDLSRICFAGFNPMFVQEQWIMTDGGLSEVADPPFLVEVLSSLVERCVDDAGEIDVSKAKKHLSKAFIDKLQETLQQLRRDDDPDGGDVDACLQAFLVGYVEDAFVLCTAADDESKRVFDASAGRPLLWKPPGDLFRQLVLIDLPRPTQPGAKPQGIMDVSRVLGAVPSFQPVQEGMIRLYHGTIASRVIQVLDQGVWLNEALSQTASDFRPPPHLAFYLSEAFSHALYHAESRSKNSLKLDSVLPVVMVFDVPIEGFKKLDYQVVKGDEWKRVVFSCRTMAQRKNNVAGLYQFLTKGNSDRAVQAIEAIFAAFDMDIDPQRVRSLAAEHGSQRTNSVARAIESAAKKVMKSLQEYDVIVGEYWRKGQKITELEKQPSDKLGFLHDPEYASLDISPERRFSTELGLTPDRFPVQYAFLSPPNADFYEDCPIGMKLLAQSLRYVIRLPPP